MTSLALTSTDNPNSPATGHAIPQPEWDQPRLTLEPIALLSDDEIESIHQHSLQVIEEIGMDVLLPEARDIYAKAGALVSDERVRIGREIIEQALKTPPAEFTFHARNPEHSIRIGGRWIAFAPVGGPPNCADLDRGRRPGTLVDNANFVRLSQYFNCIHTAGGSSVDAIDVHASIRHLRIMRNKAKLSDKVPFTNSTGRARLFDGMEIARMARGISHEQLLREPSCYTVINTNSPLKLDGLMAMGIIETARHHQVCVCTPFTLAGAMAPVTVAGALVEQNAEALAGLALSQLAKPGAPFVYGGFTSNVDMKSGAPAFGTPEYMKACIVGGQLARRYKLPYRTSSTNAANYVDAQAAYETMFSLWGAIMGGGNLIQHAAGWMEGGLVASYEKFAFDTELLCDLMNFLKPVKINGAAFDYGALMRLTAVASAKPSGANAAGDTADRANRRWKQALDDYQEPALDPAILLEIDEFVAKREREGGEITDF